MALLKGKVRSAKKLRVKRSPGATTVPGTEERFTEAIEHAVMEEFSVWDSMVRKGLVTQEAADEKKAERLQKEIAAKMGSKFGNATSINKDELAENPWKKGFKNAMRAFSIQDESYVADPEGWVKMMRSKFTQQAINKQLTPFTAIVGMYLLFCADLETARVHLTTLLFHEDPENLVKYHNWEVACAHENPTFVETHGEKISKLSVPLFPTETDALQALNDSILRLNIGGGQKGGNGRATEEAYQHFFDTTNAQFFGGGYVLPVRNPNGEPTNFYVDCSDMENKIGEMFSALERADYTMIEQLRALKEAMFHKIKALERQRFASKPSTGYGQHAGQRFAPPAAGYSRGGRGGRGYGLPYSRGGYRGGSDQQEKQDPKND